MGTPRLVDTAVPGHPEGAEAPDGIVLVLHGGGSRRDSVMMSPAQLSVLRMIPVAGRIAHAGRGRLSVHRLLNSSRGWDTHRTPVDDVAWALDRLRDRFPDRPVALVGHSLGGRAALLAGAQPGVETVVALNPYVFPSDIADLRGRRVLVVHGDQDRIALPQHSAQVAKRLSALTDVGYVLVTGGRHAMLRDGSVFEKAAADFVVAMLLGEEPRRAGVVREVLQGRSWVTT